MSDEVKKQFEKSLTLREKITLNVLMIMIKIVKATDYSQEYSDELKKIKEFIELV